MTFLKATTFTSFSIKYQLHIWHHNQPVGLVTSTLC